MQWTNTERSGHRAFLLIEGFGLFVIAPIFAMFGALGGPEVQTLSGGYIKYGSGFGFWFGIVSIPVSIAWVFVVTVTHDRSLPGVAELARLLLVEAVAIALFAALHIVLGPAALGSAPEWSDYLSFGKLLLASSIFWLCATLVALPFAFMYRNRRRRVNQVAPTGGN